MFEGMASGGRNLLSSNLNRSLLGRQHSGFIPIRVLNGTFYYIMPEINNVTSAKKKPNNDIRIVYFADISYLLSTPNFSVYACKYHSPSPLLKPHQQLGILKHLDHHGHYFYVRLKPLPMVDNPKNYICYYASFISRFEMPKNLYTYTVENPKKYKNKTILIVNIYNGMYLALDKEKKA
ncbi:unnamed protein product [Acanthoscelides obtectus]|uniref:Uncharacterized protein n=1 Tax=Acanthoscelides obtectus TaxID=200917 RepID=A0A9P0NYW2_ACAOB|nr:unnamed protein product [Acanthoscelides obtectus]CAK1657122.1 hypothetical protein AOBTE_LOCUS20136 [Acanthoscelides obtectus]